MQNSNGSIPSRHQVISYNAFNSVSKIIENNNELQFTYGADGQRRKMQHLINGSLQKTTYYLGDYEKIIAANGTETEIHYISGSEGLAAIKLTVTENNQTNNETYYAHNNYLGSILSLTDDNGVVVYEQNFDAWGKERNVSNWTYTNVSKVGTISGFEWLKRGYTGHEHLSQFGLINMNGRLYDPAIGRMLSPDNYIQSPFNTQSYNRYSYVWNNPLKYTDPSGEFVFLAAIGGAIVSGGFNILFNWDPSNTFALAVGGAVGAASGGAVFASFGPASILGVSSKVVAGASGGFVGGFSSGFTTSILSGSSIENALLSGIQGGIIGGAIGGVMGWVSNLPNPKSSTNPSNYYNPSNDPNLISSINDDYAFSIQPHVNLPTFEIIGSTNIQYVAPLPGYGIYKYTPPTFSLQYNSGVELNPTIPQSLPNFNTAFFEVGASISLFHKAIERGTFYHHNSHKLNNVQFNREIKAGRYFKSIGKTIGIAGNIFSGANLTYSFYQSYSGYETWNSFAYDIGMFGVSKIPAVGIPLSVVGTIYKDEIMNLHSTPSQFNSHDRICFAKGTLVFTEEKMINIENLKVGQFITSFNFKLNNLELKKINFVNIQKSNNIYELITETDTFIVTHEHPFYVINKGWVETKNLVIGDSLKNVNNSLIQVVSLKKLNKETEVVNIEVNDNQNFYIGKGKILVHNSKYSDIKILNENVNEKDN